MFFNKKVGEYEVTLLITNLLKWMFVFGEEEKINEVVEIIYENEYNFSKYSVFPYL